MIRTSELTRTDQKFFLRAVQAVEAEAGMGGVHLKVEDRRLDGLLLVAREAGEAGREGVGDEEGSWSGTERSYGPLLDVFKSRQDLRNQAPEIRQSIRTRPKSQDGDRPPAQHLLVRDAPVHREECVEASLHPREELSVGHTLPPEPGDREDLMITPKQRGKSDWQVLVK